MEIQTSFEWGILTRMDRIHRMSEIPIIELITDLTANFANWANYLVRSIRGSFLFSR
jgi:hypothetical protein